MTPSIYDMRDNEIEAARKIRRERVWGIVGGIIAAPIVAALFYAWIILCAVM